MEGNGGGGEGRWNCEARGKTGRRAGGEGSEGARSEGQMKMEEKGKEG